MKIKIIKPKKVMENKLAEMSGATRIDDVVRKPVHAREIIARIGAIRRALESQRLIHTRIMAYSAKYASA